MLPYLLLEEQALVHDVRCLSLTMVSHECVRSLCLGLLFVHTHTAAFAVIDVGIYAIKRPSRSSAEKARDHGRRVRARRNKTWRILEQWLASVSKGGCSPGRLMSFNPVSGKESESHPLDREAWVGRGNCIDLGFLLPIPFSSYLLKDQYRTEDTYETSEPRFKMKLIHTASLELLALALGSIAAPNPKADVVIETIIHEQGEELCIRKQLI